MNAAPNPFRSLALEPILSREYSGCLKSELTGLPIRVIITPHLALLTYLFAGLKPCSSPTIFTRKSFRQFFAPELSRDPLKLASSAAPDGRTSRTGRRSSGIRY